MPKFVVGPIALLFVIFPAVAIAQTANPNLTRYPIGAADQAEFRCRNPGSAWQ